MSKNNNIELVIFDMDGVIVDSEPTHMKAEKKSFEALGLNVSKEEQDSFVGLDQEGMWLRLKNNHNLDQSVEELLELHLENLYDYFENDETLDTTKNYKNFLNNLVDNNIKTAVASSSPRKLIEIILKRFNIENHFNTVISGEEVENGKPAPDIFEAVCDELKVDREKAIVIEDSHNGVRAASAANIKCIGYQNPNSGDQDLSIANKIIKDFNEISHAVLV